MAESKASGMSSENRSHGKKIDWAGLRPSRISHEDTMSPQQVKECWARIYDYAGLRNPGEETQAACRLAVYAYCCVNGTSREGEYSGDCIMSDGTSFPASAIPRAAGKMRIRRFLRGNIDESYESLKTSGVIERDERYVARVAKLSIPADHAFATSDWMTDCSRFTPSETKAHEKTFAFGLSRSGRSRGGKTLEEVEDHRVDESLTAQNAGVQKDGPVVF